MLGMQCKVAEGPLKHQGCYCDRAKNLETLDHDSNSDVGMQILTRKREKREQITCKAVEGPLKDQGWNYARAKKTY